MSGPRKAREDPLPSQVRDWVQTITRETRQRRTQRRRIIARYATLDHRGTPRLCAHPRPPHRRKVIYPDVAAAQRAARALFDTFGGHRSTAYPCLYADHAHLTSANDPEDVPR